MDRKFDAMNKVAWIRAPGYPMGQPAPGRLNCPCKNAPFSTFADGPDITCHCGTVYSWDGWIVKTLTHRSE